MGLDMLWNRVRRAATASLLAVGALAAPLLAPATAWADAVSYANGQRTLKVGILLVDSTTDLDGDGTVTPVEQAAGPENPDPYVFHIADQRRDVKPVGWEFVNPLAPKTVTPDILNRWSARDPGHPYRAGQPVVKNMACYWEVSLSKTPLADLIQYDVLLLTTHARLRFSLADREKLRKLVDAGGVLWMDDCGGMRIDPRGPFFLEEVQFQGGSAPVGVAAGPQVLQPNHPLLTTPRRLTLRDIALLGEATDYRNRSLASIGPGGATVQTAPNPNILTNVVANRAMPDGAGGFLPYIAVGNYGSGMVVATSGDTGCAINDYVGGNSNVVGSGPNSGAYLNGGNLERAHEEDLLFVYNLVNLNSASNAYRRNNRRVGVSGETFRAPLTTSFDFTAAGTPPDAQVNSVSAPLIVRDKVYVSGLDAAGNVTVRCYNARPSFTRGDQGVPDLAFGAPYDEVWRYTGPASGGRQPSTPVLATVYTGNPARPYLDVLYVTLPDGSLVGMEALPTDAGGNPLPVNATALLDNIGSNLKGSPATYDGVQLANGAPGPAPAPVFFENRVYVAQPDGVVRCVSAPTLVPLWTSVDAAPADEITPTGSPTLGVVRLTDSTGNAGRGAGNVASRSGGNTSDVMLYVPVLKTADSTGKILPFWLGARHEVIEGGNAGNFSTRVSAGGTNPWWVANGQGLATLPFIQPQVRVYDNRNNYDNGIQNTSYTGTVFRPDGIVEVRDAAGNPPPPGTLISVDYDVLYVRPGGAAPGVPPGQAAGSDGARRGGGVDASLDAPNWMGGLELSAMAPDDTQFFVARQGTGAPSGGGGLSGAKTSIWGTREQYGGPGATKLRQSFTILESAAPEFTWSVDLPTGGQVSLVERPTFVNRFVFGGPFSHIGSSASLPDGPPEGLVDIAPVGAPIVGNDGVLYVLLRGRSPSQNRPVTILAALDSEKDVTLRLPEAYDGTRPVTVTQVDPLTDPADAMNPLQTRTQTLSNRGNNGILDGDPDTGRITLRDMKFGQYRFSSGQSFLVTYFRKGQTQPIVKVLSSSTRIQSVNNGAGEASDPAVPRQDYSPLLWYYVLPVEPTGGATRVGDAIYFCSDRGIVALDADPTANDPGVRPGEPILNVFETLVRPGGTSRPSVNHVRWVRPLTDNTGAPHRSYAPPVGGPEVIAANTDFGSWAFENSVTLVADSSRIIEVGGDGAPLWAMDGTVRQSVVGGTEPIFDPVAPVAGTGRRVFERRPFTRPTVARRLGDNDYLVADTGNNRLVRTSRAARVTWELSTFSDPFNVLRSGDTTTLNNPTDVHVYRQISFDPADPFGSPALGYEDHYVIADSGNFRVVEVVDYYDNQGNIRTIAGVNGPARGEHVVVWVSRTLTRQGRKLSFKGAQRVYSARGGVSGIPGMVAVIDNASAAGDGAATRSDFTGGSLVALDYRPVNTFFVLRNAAGGVIPPAPWAPTGTPTTSGFPWPLGNAEPPANGLVSDVLDELTFKAGTLMPNGAPLGADFVYKVTRPTYFQQLTLGGNRIAYLICDANGVYQVEPQPGGERRITWFLSQEDYNRINAQRILSVDPAAIFDPASLPRLLAVSAERLPNGHVLITNSATGPSGLFADGQFRGEVLEVTGDLRYTTTGTPAIPVFGSFSAPAWAVTVPAAAPRRAVVKQRMGGSDATYSLEQPLFADRL